MVFSLHCFYFYVSEFWGFKPHWQIFPQQGQGSVPPFLLAAGEQIKVPLPHRSFSLICHAEHLPDCTELCDCHLCTFLWFLKSKVKGASSEIISDSWQRIAFWPCMLCHTECLALPSRIKACSYHLFLLLQTLDWLSWLHMQTEDPKSAADRCGSG